MYLQKVISKGTLKRAVSGSFSKRYVSEDPDPYQNITDPEHCLYNKTHHTKGFTLNINENYDTRLKGAKIANHKASVYAQQTIKGKKHTL